jgi:flagellar protein FlaG
MPMNPMDAPAALDLRMRENAGGVKPKRATVPAPAAAPPADAPDAEQQAQDAAQQQPIPAAGPNLKFSVDEKTGKSVVALVDPANGKVLRQMPNEEALKVAEAIGRFQGMFVDLKV